MQDFFKDKLETRGSMNLNHSSSLLTMVSDNIFVVVFIMCPWEQMTPGMQPI